jgi:hypothetical protein
MEYTITYLQNDLDVEAISFSICELEVYIHSMLAMLYCTHVVGGDLDD